MLGSMLLDQAAMQARMASYFTAEKNESAFFVIAGLLAVVCSAALLRVGGPFRGMLAPLLLIGLIQLGVGGSVYLRTDRQLATLTSQLHQAPDALRRDETARMAQVMKSFRLYKMIEILVLGAGVALVFAFPYPAVLHGVGIGCIIQGSLMLVLDLFAEARGHDYLAALAALSSG